jgi:serine beta-lactamase-like protein LACTB
MACLDVKRTSSRLLSMVRMRLAPTYLPALLVLGLTSSLCAQEAPSRPERLADDRLGAAILAVHETQQNVGLAVVVYRAGELTYAQCLGKADLDHDVDVHAGTRFGIASVTKLFTAVTLLNIYGDGEISLDAPVQEYVPDYPEKPEGEITLRMLATHRSGIPHPDRRTPELFATHYETATAAIEVFVDEELLFAPGSSEHYSSSNYNLLAAAIEGATGKPFAEVVQERVFAPLELEGISFDDILRPLPHRARRYSFYHPWTYAESKELFAVPIWDYSFNVGGGNIVSTADDLARFGQALVEPGLLPPDELEQLFEWFGDTDDRGRAFLFASGSNPGVQAGLAVYPQDKLSVVVLANTWGVGSRSGEMVTLATKLAGLITEND